MISLLKGAVLIEPPANARERAEVESFARCDGADWYAPNWNDNNPVHNWRNYAPPVLRRLWPTLTAEQKQTVAFALQLAADSEHWD